ncbi:MAG: MmgE/PrpD family protein [Firmicutes bacterium]|nr:MmgE/PrpD family protein [Bacillota bacterium]
MNGSDRTALFVGDIKWNDLPDKVKSRALICLLDNLGVTMAGTLAPISKIATPFAVSNWGGSEATILLYKCSASAPGAAFANACAGNALDLDDDAIYTRGHPGAQLFPAALAVAEKVGSGGRELLEALVVGYEVSIRAGRCWHDLHEVYQSCGSWGSVGCAAAAAHLLKLNREEIKNALGIAEYHAPNAPMMRDIYNPTMVKHAIGWGAMNGVTSALLAKSGYTGMPGLLGMEKYYDWVSDIGETYWMTDWVFYKEWASCAWGHAAGVAVLELMIEHKVTPAQIKSVRVKTFEEAAMLYQGYPTTTEEAQFSIKWPLACLILDHELGPDQVLEERFNDPEVLAVFDRIEMVVDPEIDQLYKEMKEMDLRMHSAVEITLQDERVLDSGVIERGADRYSEQDLENKFRKLAAFVTDPGTVNKLVEMVWNFDSIENVRKLTNLIK